MKAKMTPWLSSKLTPVRNGVYEREYKVGRRVFTEWNGQEWGWGFYEGNEKPEFSRGADQNRRWRGLANPSKEAA